AELRRLAGERVAVEHDEVGVPAGEERPAGALVVRQPGGRDAHRVERLLKGQALVVAPVVENRREDACPRLELLDRGVRAVCEYGARVEERTERVRPVEAVGPEALRQLLVRGRVRELEGDREPAPLRRPISRRSPSRSAGVDCQTRSGSAPCCSSRCQRPIAPSQPSLSWRAVTPHDAATRTPSRIASTYSSSGTWTNLRLKAHAASS